MPEILFIDLLKLLKEGVRTDRVRLSAGVSSTNRKPLKRQSMKTYCKTVDITDRKLIQKAVYKCLKKKYKRRDSLTMFSEYTGLPTNTIKGMFNITIRRRVFLRVRRSYKKAQSLVKQRKKIPIWLARKCMSYKGILDHTNSYNIKRRYNANKTIQICKGVISHESKIRHYTRECYC